MSGVRRLGLVVVAALAVVLAASTAGAADPPLPQHARAARAVAKWRKLGTRALPAVMRAYCGHDEPVGQAAEQELRRYGLASVDALLLQTSDSCVSRWLASELLCQVSPLDDASLRVLLSRLTPQVTAPAKQPGANPLWLMLSVIYPASNDSEGRRPCVNRDQVAKAMLDVLLTPQAVARIAPANRETFALIFPALVSSQPSRAGAFVPTLARWLDEWTGAPYRVLGAVAAAGPEGAPAVPALRAYLARELKRLRQRTGQDAVSPKLSSVAEAATAIGIAARPMLGELRDALTVAAGNICDLNRSRDAGIILEAIGTLDASAWESVRPTAETAWRRGNNCGSLSLSIGGDLGRWGRQQLMDGVGAFGPAAASFQVLLRPVLSDVRASFDTRGHAARALRRTGARLDAHEAPLARLLEVRLARLMRVEEQSERSGRPLERGGAQAALAAITDCMADANIVHSKPATSADLDAFSYDEHGAFADCVGDRICGPHTDVLGETLSTCCAFAYARTRPPFCR